MIYVDMDGVLVDFVYSALLAQGIEQDLAVEIINDWPPGEWDVSKVAGVEPGEFWTNIDATPLFWHKLDITREYHKIVWWLRNHGIDWMVCSTPSRHPDSSAGKVYWLRDRLGDTFRNYVLTPHKSHLAAPGRLLLDDSDRNVDAWRAAGGEAILWPQPWNTSHARDKGRALEEFKNAATALHRGKSAVSSSGL